MASPASLPPLRSGACPIHEVLAAFDRGELPADTAEPVAAHVETCAACQAALGALIGSADPLLNGLRHVADQPPLPTVLTGPPLAAAAIGPPGYQLLEEVGSGGMGVVYRARDLRLAREVAIKLLRDDYPAESAVCARFVAEAQITGQLQHPGIPAIHELGTLPAGRPFLAMKLVKGRTLHELLRERPDPAYERGRFVAAFEQVCQAVGYAHAHGVIHRDLKPGNVMVGAFGEVMVMDWGLAKVLASRERQRPEDDGADLPETVAALTAIDTPLAGDSATRTGAVMGTPAYMPPEQAGGEVRKLDARSDVFGLGAILCQILTGQPPFSGKDANEVRLKAVRGEVHEALARLDESGADPDLVALCKQCLAFRQEDRPADGEAVVREVARIRQAAEERARRAETERAAALVREAEQRKRRRQLLVAAVLVAAVLLAGIAGTAAGLLRARQSAEAERLAKLDAQDKEQKARDAAVAESEAKKHAQEAAAAEKQANEQAQKRLKQIEQSNEVLTSVFTDLDIRKFKQGTEPLEAVLAQRLVKAAEELEGEAVGDPLVVANLQNRLGLALLGLGHAKEGVPLFDKARATRSRLLGADHPDTLASMNNLALAYQDAGQLDKALPLYEEALRLYKAKLGADHPATLGSMNNLGSAYADAGQFDKALPLYEEALRLYKAKLGADHPATLGSMNNLAVAYQDAGQLDKALPLCEEALRLCKAKLGADHPNTLASMNNLAYAYQKAGHMDKALPLYEEALRGRKAKLGADHPDTLRSMNNLANAYRDAGQLNKALPLFEKVLPLLTAKLGADHPNTLAGMNNLANAYRDAGQLDKAVPLFEETLRLQRAKLGADHPSTLLSMNNLALAYQDAGQLDKALPLYEEALRGRKAKLGADHPDTLLSLNNLARAYCTAKRGGKAVPLFAEYFEHQRKRSKPNDAGLAGPLAVASQGLLSCQRYQEAEPYLRECLAICEKVRPDSWTTFSIQSLFGGALLGQKKYAEAEPPLLKGYEGMKLREVTIPKDAKVLLTEAAGRLVALYDAWGKPAEAAKWRTELARRKQADNKPNK